MKNKFKVMAGIVILLAVGVWQLYNKPSYEDFDYKNAAYVYNDDGVLTGDTTIFIYGRRSSYLFRDDSAFEGKLIIPTYEVTYGGTALIRRMEDHNIHQLFYAQVEPFMAQEINAPILLSDMMTSFALSATDGKVFATSHDLDELYADHVRLSGNGTTIERIDEIPVIH